MAQHGTLTLADLLEVRQASVVEYGIDTITEIIQRDLANHNREVDDLLLMFTETTSDMQRATGTSVSGGFRNLSEWARDEAQKVAPGDKVGFPMEKYGRAVGWTHDFFVMSTVQDLAVQYDTILTEDLTNIRNLIRDAIYKPTNRTFLDRFVHKGFELTVKAFLNADGAPIPNGPNNEVFDGASHTHYLANATLTNAKLKETVNTVVEHGNGEGVKVIINVADEEAVSALSGFKAREDPRLIIADDRDYVRDALDTTRVNDRAIGLFGAAEVWVKPWAYQNYAAVVATGGGIEKPLVQRVHPVEGMRGLRMAFTYDTHPLYADAFERYLGLGAWNRSATAVLQFNNATYQDPT